MYGECALFFCISIFAEREESVEIEKKIMSELVFSVCVCVRECFDANKFN